MVGPISRLIMSASYKSLSDALLLTPTVSPDTFPIFLDFLLCDGSELTLFNCPPESHGLHECSSMETVNMQCAGKSILHIAGIICDHNTMCAYCSAMVCTRIQLRNIMNFCCQQMSTSVWRITEAVITHVSTHWDLTTVPATLATRWILMEKHAWV